MSDDSTLRAEGHERGSHLVTTRVAEPDEQDVWMSRFRAVRAGHRLQPLTGESVREGGQEVVDFGAVDQQRDGLVHHLLDRGRGVNVAELVGESVDRPNDVLACDRVELVDRSHRVSCSALGRLRAM
jgi:hypothetical protein